MMIDGKWMDNITCPHCRYRHPAELSCEDAELAAIAGERCASTSDEWLEGEIGTWLESGSPESFKTVTVDEVMSLLIFFKGRVQ